MDAPLSLVAKDRTEVRLCPVAANHGVILDEAMGHHEAAPIEDGVAVDGDSELAWIAGEEADEVEVVAAHHVDGGLGCLHRHVELIAPVLPRDREGRAAGELHLLAGAAVVALGYLHSPEDALVLGAQLCEISESEMCHAAVV